MSDKHDSDLDWLYRRDDAPEATRVIPESASPYSGTAGSARPAAQGYPQPSSPPVAAQPAGYPPSTGYDGYRQSPPPQQPQATTAPPAPPKDQPRTKRPRRRRPIRKIITLLVLAWILFMVGTPIYAWTIGNVVATGHSGERPAEQPGTAVLLVGSDDRESLTAEQQGELGTGDTEGRRTDSMMLLYQPPSGKSALISLPRDSWVSVPGHGEAKLNAAYAWGGAPLLIQTIEHNTGIRIDGYLEVGFLGVVEAVDAVGGIEVCLDEAVVDEDAHLDLPAGCQTIDGKTALSYVRMRKADPTGDIGRMARQREVIGKVAKKAINPLTLLNPIAYWKLNMAAANTLGRGDTTGVGELLGGVQVFMGSALGSSYTLTVPVADAGATRDGQSVVLWDEEASQVVFNAVTTGNTEALSTYSS